MCLYIISYYKNLSIIFYVFLHTKFIYISRFFALNSSRADEKSSALHLVLWFLLVLVVLVTAPVLGCTLCSFPSPLGFTPLFVLFLARLVRIHRFDFVGALLDNKVIPLIFAISILVNCVHRTAVKPADFLYVSFFNHPSLERIQAFVAPMLEQQRLDIRKLVDEPNHLVCRSMRRLLSGGLEDCPFLELLGAISDFFFVLCVKQRSCNSSFGSIRYQMNHRVRALEVYRNIRPCRSLRQHPRSCEDDFGSGITQYRVSHFRSYIDYSLRQEIRFFRVILRKNLLIFRSSLDAKRSIYIDVVPLRQYPCLLHEFQEIQHLLFPALCKDSNQDVHFLCHSIGNVLPEAMLDILGVNFAIGGFVYHDQWHFPHLFRNRRHLKETVFQPIVTSEEKVDWLEFAVLALNKNHCCAEDMGVHKERYFNPRQDLDCFAVRDSDYLLDGVFDVRLAVQRSEDFFLSGIFFLHFLNVFLLVLARIVQVQRAQFCGDFCHIDVSVETISDRLGQKAGVINVVVRDENCIDFAGVVVIDIIQALISQLLEIAVLNLNHVVPSIREFNMKDELRSSHFIVICAQICPRS